MSLLSLSSPSFGSRGEKRKAPSRPRCSPSPMYLLPSLPYKNIIKTEPTPAPRSRGLWDPGAGLRQRAAGAGAAARGCGGTAAGRDRGAAEPCPRGGGVGGGRRLRLNNAQEKLQAAKRDREGEKTPRHSSAPSLLQLRFLPSPAHCSVTAPLLSIPGTPGTPGPAAAPWATRPGAWRGLRPERAETPGLRAPPLSPPPPPPPQRGRRRPPGSPCPPRTSWRSASAASW